ncbi:MAG: phosphate butyryltransferase [Clostridiales Family XIII bacterium]|jgi:phosphate butyryltransferase|nr:phosphate butyryltransferase [Clostridiales Family XIII bacterium]
MLTSFDTILTDVKAQPKKVIAIAAAADDVVFQAVKRVEQEMGISECLFTGKKANILKCAEKAGYSITDEKRIFEAETDAEAAMRAVELVRAGDAHLPMKGQLQTPDYLRAILNKEQGLRGSGALSHTGVYELPDGRLFILTDCAMTIAPDLETKIKIVENAVSVARRLGAETPNVAMLSFLEHVNPVSIHSTEAAVISKMAERGQIKNCVIDGPLAYDNALYAEAARHKGITSPVAGNADILVVPHIDVGNPLSKALSMTAGLRFGGLVAGATVPVIMTPRADPATSKVLAIVLCQYILENSKKN